MTNYKCVIRCFTIPCRKLANVYFGRTTRGSCISGRTHEISAALMEKNKKLKLHVRLGRGCCASDRACQSKSHH